MWDVVRNGTSGMTAEEAFALLDILLPGQVRKDIQHLVFYYAWLGWTYPKIAEQIGYDTSYVRDVGAELWRQLSEAVGMSVTKRNLQTHLRQYLSLVSATTENQSTSDYSFTDRPPCNLTTKQQWHWQETVEVSRFYGRHHDLSTLRHWIVGDRCRIVVVLGMGGMGKTTLAAKLATQVQTEFDCLIWQSLRHAPVASTVFSHLLDILSYHQATAAPTQEALLNQLMGYFRSVRCLLVLDNFDAILGSTASEVDQASAGRYREGYELYGAWLQQMGTEHHASCLLITSREKPGTLLPLEGERSLVRSMTLQGLTARETQQICEVANCFCETETEWQRLTAWYSGNPLALKIVSTTIRDVYDGSVSQFLQEGTIAFGEITSLLAQQLRHLSSVEQQVTYWLAINRDWTTIAELREDCLPPPSSGKLLEALQSLTRRSLIEKRRNQFTLQPVVMEYVTSQFITNLCKEIRAKNLDSFNRYAVLKATAKDYIQDSQIRLIIRPLIEELLDEFRSKNMIREQLDKILTQLQQDLPSSGYVAGNLLNLFAYLNLDLEGYDFSHLTLWQADLRTVPLRRVNFANTDLTKTLFCQDFGWILAIAYSPCGQYYATGDLQGKVDVWLATTGTKFISFAGHSNWVWAVCFSPDKEWLASSGDDNTIKLWHLPTGQEKILFQGTHSIWALTFSPEGQWLAAGSHDSIVYLWQVSTGALVKQFQGHSAEVWTVAFSADGQLLASGGSDRTIRLWNVITGDCLSSLQGHTNSIRCLAFNAVPINSHKHHNPVNRCLLASGSSDHTIRLWDVQTKQCLNILTDHSDAVWSIAFVPSPSHPLESGPAALVNESIYQSWQTGCLLASAGVDRNIRLWDSQTGQCLNTLSGHRDTVCAIAFSPDGKTLISGSDHVKIWDVATQHSLTTITGQTEHVLAVAFHPDGRMLASGHADGQVRLWDSRTGRLLKTSHPHERWVWSVGFDATGQYMASNSEDRTMKILDTATGMVRQTLSRCAGWAWQANFSPQGQWLAGVFQDGNALLWNRQTNELQIFPGHQDWVRAVQFSRDGEQLATGGAEGQIHLWDWRSNQIIQTFCGHAAAVRAIAFSAIIPRSIPRYLVSAGADCVVKVWDINTGDLMQSLIGHSNTIRSIAHHPSQPLVVSAGEDYTIRVWNTITGQCLHVLQEHAAPVASVTLPSTGAIDSCAATLLASASEDGTIKLWDLNTGKSLRTLRPERLYEGMNITGARGINESQKSALIALGAIELA